MLSYTPRIEYYFQEKVPTLILKNKNFIEERNQ